MSVKSGDLAVTELRHRLGHVPPTSGTGPAWEKVPEQYPFVRAAPPTGFSIAPPGADGVWGPSEDVPPLRDPASYALDGLVSELNLTTADGMAIPDTKERLTYCERSIDITMRGGTTSGVVYPMAVCELARQYRLRNIGGASAGAIAAAAAAAAELGRSGGPNAPQSLPVADRRQGHVRTGFAGFADCMAWLAQVDDTSSDEFRVGQLFRPTQRALPLFRLAVAYMRRRYLAIPALFAGAFGWVSKWMNILIAAASLLLAGLWLGRYGSGAQHGRGSLLSSTHSGTGHHSTWQTAWRYVYALTQGALGLVALTVLVGAALIGALWIAARLGKKAGPAEMAEPLPTDAEPGAGFTAPAALLAGAGGLLADRFVFGVPLLGLTTVWLFAIVALVVVAIVSVLRLALGAERHSFGLVSGASPKVRKSPWNWVAGMPRGTIDRPLVQWLSETISELAGLAHDTPLRFGHLWFGSGYKSPDDAQALARCREAAADPGKRLTNLELVTTELVQGLGYRFPLPPSDEMESETYSALYLRRQDLEAAGARIFPPAVVDDLCAAPAEPDVYDRHTGASITDLHRLPEPWDLPVIFAVRLSMSLPALLEAVRVYRISKVSSTVRDEFGLPVSESGQELHYPAKCKTKSAKVWAEELWFSDGGITSNFPIHLFDSLFPMWPTVGINLSRYPPGFGHQDVWLPQDWQGHQVIGAPVSGGMTGFIGAIIDAARGWRDTAQSQMPSYVGRIATVRQSKSEGGTNLYMSKEAIAALALRGELAGARLRRRFRSRWWERNQWLRFRTSIGNLEELRDEVHSTTTFAMYERLAASGSAELNAVKGSLTMGDPDTPDQFDWRAPTTVAYWPHARSLLARINAVAVANELKDGVPKPEPELRQVPPS